jgi:hypothetical protein
VSEWWITLWFRRCSKCSGDAVCTEKQRWEDSELGRIGNEMTRAFNNISSGIQWDKMANTHNLSEYGSLFSKWNKIWRILAELISARMVKVRGPIARWNLWGKLDKSCVVRDFVLLDYLAFCVVMVTPAMVNNTTCIWIYFMCVASNSGNIFVFNTSLEQNTPDL